MRLETRTLWLLAGFSRMAAGDATATTSTATTSAPSSGDVFTYDTTIFPTSGVPVVFAFADKDQLIHFSFSDDSEASIVKVTLFKHDNGEGNSYSEIGEGKPTGHSAAAGGSSAPDPLPASGSSASTSETETTASRVRRQMSPLPSATISLPVNSDSVNLTIHADQDQWSNFLEVYLYLQFDWEGSEQSGSSYSPVFGVARNTPGSPDYQNFVNMLGTQNGNGTSPFKDESVHSSASAVSGSSSSMPTGASADGSASSPAMSGGLSTGAAAGIGVGVGVAGLLLIGLLLWFFCRQRKQSKRDGHDTSSRAFTGASYRSDSGVMMPDKEAGLGMGSVMDGSSPRSAYGEESARFGGASSAAPRVSIGLDDSPQHPQPHARGLSDDAGPYTDHGAAGAGTATARGRQSSLDDSIGGARSLSPPVNTRYAHLVEEGMTEHEIRRLEEEERHLDAAIEQAGSRQGHRR